MWTLRPHIWAKMIDVGDLPVLTFGNCVLKTGVIKWPLKLYVRFLRFFSKSKNMTFYFFWVVAHVFSNTSTSDHNNIAMRAHDHVIAAAVAFFASQLKRCSQLWLRCACDKTCQSPCDVIILSYFNLLTSTSYVIQVPPWRMKSS